MGGDDTDIQAEGQVTPKPTEPPVLAAPLEERPRPPFHRGWTEFLPWLTVPGMTLGFGSVYFHILLFFDGHPRTGPFSRPADREVFWFAALMGAMAVSLGLLGYWLSRREIARIEKELVYPRARPVTIESRRWALVGLVCGVLGLIPAIIVAASG